MFINKTFMFVRETGFNGDIAQLKWNVAERLITK